MKQLKDMRNKEIVQELVKRSINRNEYVTEDGKTWKGRKELIELLMKPIHEARDTAREELQNDYSKAVSFWKQLKGIEMMDETDFSNMTSSWKILKSLIEINPDDGAFDLRKSAESLKEIFCPMTDISKYSQDELSEFVSSNLEAFRLSAFTERLTKESTDIIKMSMDNMEFTKDGVIFDSSQAVHLTGKKIDYDKKNSIMRIVESAEDGISRMLQEKGKSSLTVFMGQMSVTNDGEEQKMIDSMKELVFRNGVTDIATGKHYMWAFQNPSSARKANFMFVEAQDWDEVCQLWLDITGIKDWELFENTFLS